MTREPEETESAWTTVLQGIREHPIITGVLVSSILLGAVLGYTFLAEDWSVTRRLLGGAVGGAGVGLIVTATRMIG